MGKSIVNKIIGVLIFLQHNTRIITIISGVGLIVGLILFNSIKYGI